MDLRYPVGPFKFEGTLSPEQRLTLIDQIATTPEKMRAAVAGLSEEQLDTSYRPRMDRPSGGPSCPDSHLNSYVRFKLALTEEHPTIRAYDENLWANTMTRAQRPLKSHWTCLRHCIAAGFYFYVHSTTRILHVRFTTLNWEYERG